MSRRDELEVPKLLALILTKLIDEHHLAVATFTISDLVEAAEGRTLLMAADYARDQVYLRVCYQEDQRETMALMKAACTQEE